MMHTNGGLYTQSSWPNDSIVAVYVGLGIFAALLLLRIWIGNPAKTAGFIRHYPVVLLPTILMMNVIWLLDRVPWLTASTPAYHPLGLTLQLSGMFITSIVCTPLSVWATVCLTHCFAELRPPAPTTQQAWRFVVASLLVAIGMLMLIVALGPLFKQMGSIVLVLMGVICVVFNLLSCTWYALMMTDEPKLWPSLRDAAQFGVRRWGPLSVRVALQLFFAGFLVIYNVTTERWDSPPLPSPPIMPGSGNVGSFGGSVGGGTHTYISNGWEIQLIWVLSADRGNSWLQVTSAQAHETPWLISRYLVDSLTVMVSTYFIVGYSLVFLRRPITARLDRRPGFEVLPSTPSFLDPAAQPLPVLDVIERPEN